MYPSDSIHFTDCGGIGICKVFLDFKGKEDVVESANKLEIILCKWEILIKI